MPNQIVIRPHLSIVLLLFALISSEASVFAQIASQPIVNPRNVADFVHKFYRSGIPYEQAQRYGEESTAALLSMLNDPKEEVYWTNIILTLGMIGDERVIEPLISFLEFDHPSTSVSVYRAKLSVLTALGYAANRSKSPRPLEYLKASTHPAKWDAFKINILKAGGLTAEQSTTQLITQAIIGLALSGKSEARESLQRLKEAQSENLMRNTAELLPMLEEAIEANTKIAKDGLAAYESINAEVH